ncbi:MULTISPECIES: electron transfer flavoprotein beta subunit/FixA family protein [unclassified Actinotalea]|uniref:electron transfer flavoprotein subunit beta/FixA family protein n=1 Tax=unclassified Actinotalea TaxID=2638618 RepID=UPI0015F6EDBF|nr:MULTISPECIES: electron transfer flavoprotein beta subunit/FixA family protein [unclassified Actinotalea]
MKIVVAYKWAPNPQHVEVRPDGTVDPSRAKASVSEYDPVAFELARALADTTGDEVVGLTVGDASIDTPLGRKAALSRGLDRLVVVADDALAGADGTRLAAVLAAAVRSLGDVRVVLTGDSSIDVAAGQVPMTLAGHLGWLGLTSVSSVVPQDGGLVVEREAPAGVVTLAVSGPAVLATTTDAVVPRVPGMKDILGAAKKPVQVLPLAELDVPAPGTVVTTVGTARPAAGDRRGIVLDGSDPAAAATELVGALRQAGVL